jgi:hypothetical protein
VRRADAQPEGSLSKQELESLAGLVQGLLPFEAVTAAAWSPHPPELNNSRQPNRPPSANARGLHITTLSDRTGRLSDQTGKRQGRTMHDIISDIIDWDQANKTYTAGEGQSGERYIQRLEAAGQMAEIEARWHHLPEGFHDARKLIKIHIQAIAETSQLTSKEEVCWLAIAAASAWIPQREPAETALP